MLYKVEKLLQYLFTVPYTEARAAWIHRVRFEKSQSKSVVEHYEANGFERIDTKLQMTQDGREVITVGSIKLVLQKEIHDARIAERIQQAVIEKEKEQANTQPTVVESYILDMCPQMVDGVPCGGSLNISSVCPSCVTGALGFKYRYSCDKCSFDIVTKVKFI